MRGQNVVLEDKQNEDLFISQLYADLDNRIDEILNLEEKRITLFDALGPIFSAISISVCLVYVIIS